MSQIAGPFVYGHLESLSCACIAGRIALGGLKTCPPTDGDQALCRSSSSSSSSPLSGPAPSSWQTQSTVLSLLLNHAPCWQSFRKSLCWRFQSSLEMGVSESEIVLKYTFNRDRAISKHKYELKIYDSSNTWKSCSLINNSFAITGNLGMRMMRIRWCSAFWIKQVSGNVLVLWCVPMMKSTIILQFFKI